jgi:hypothetical protein
MTFRERYEFHMALGDGPVMATMLAIPIWALMAATGVLAVGAIWVTVPQ